MKKSKKSLKKKLAVKQGTPRESDDEWEALAGEGSLTQRLSDPDREVVDGSNPDALLVELDGFEGPLDLLLGLSRARKIDITKLSIAELATQYIGYINNIKQHRLEIAADYLVMAAWLVYLKSKLLLPSDEVAGEEPSGDLLAAQLAFRLKRLEAMRLKGQELMARPQLGQEFFGSGAPEGFMVVSSHKYKADLYDLLKAYAVQRQRVVKGGYKVKRREVWSIKKARSRLSSLLGISIEWAPINDLISSFMNGEVTSKTTVASTFGATLEMARDGIIEIKQGAHFEPLYVKSLRDKEQG